MLTNTQVYRCIDGPRYIDVLASTATMAPNNSKKGPYQSAQKHLEDARSPILGSHVQKKGSIERQLLSEPAKQAWPEGARYLREEIAPEGYTGRIETIYSLNKDKQRDLQIQLSPTKQLQGQLKARARQAQAKEIADKAIAKRRLQRAALERDKAEATSVQERDWMAEVDRGMLCLDTSLCELTDDQDPGCTRLSEGQEPAEARNYKKK
jgi:hypothetical protein